MLQYYLRKWGTALRISNLQWNLFNAYHCGPNDDALLFVLQLHVPSECPLYALLNSFWLTWVVYKPKNAKTNWAKQK